jgi:hypothetical protein
VPLAQIPARAINKPCSAAIEYDMRVNARREPDRKCSPHFRAFANSLKLFHSVMAGLVPAIHVLLADRKGVDARHKAGHNELDGNTRVYCALFESDSKGD